jgi:hypothetical protein
MWSIIAKRADKSFDQFISDKNPDLINDLLVLNLEMCGVCSD